MTVAACLKAGTRADVAWIVDAKDLRIGDWSHAVVFTPGGGKVGSLVSGVLDPKLAELAGTLSAGRLIDIDITQIDALVNELPTPGSAQCILAPADTFPGELWVLAAARRPFCLVVELAGDEIGEVLLYSEETIARADTAVQDAFAAGVSRSEFIDGRVVSIFAAIPQIVVVGGGPVASAVVELADFVGWKAHLATEGAEALGLIAPLSARDKVVVAAHDLELAGSALAAAIDSDCGYIGSVGSRKMQADRADWLAYRGVTDLSRAHGPAGLDIGASTPAEIAVAIIAEALAVGRSA
jgi:xanthine dehydrogenase accessory factor